MRVKKKNWLHKLLRPLLNYLGRKYSGCLICGDRWSWKKEHSFEFRKGSSAFPICEECWQSAPDHLIKLATYELGRKWVLQSASYLLLETLKDAKLLRRAVDKALEKRKEMEK